MFDTLIAGADVLDGTGAPAFKADAGVVGERIVDIGDLARAAAATRVQANGLSVAPGATPASPRCCRPAGIHHVRVNGVPVLRDGARNDAQPGRVLRG